MIPRLGRKSLYGRVVLTVSRKESWGSRRAFITGTNAALQYDTNGQIYTTSASALEQSKELQSEALARKTGEAPSSKDTVNSVLYDIAVGSMDWQTWQITRDLLVQLAKSGDAQQAENVLDRLVSEAHRQDNLTVNAVLYNMCIDAWAKQGNARKASALLNKMQSRYDMDPKTAVPADTISYNSLLDAWARCKDDVNKDNQHDSLTAPQQVEALISTMEALAQSDPDGPIQPDTHSYNLVLLCYANRSHEYGSAQKAEDWLIKLSKMATNSVVGPDATSFNTVLKAWSNAASTESIKGAPNRAHEILKLMIRLYQAGHDNCRPDHVSFRTVAHAYGQQRNREAATRAQEVLEQALELQLPDVNLTLCFNRVLQAWSWSGASDAGERAEELLLKFHQSGNQSDSTLNGGIQPDTYSYSYCVDAHASNEGGVRKADALLHKLLLAYKNGETKVLPDKVTFNRVIYAWINSDEEDRAQKATDILFLMDELSEEAQASDSRPGQQAYNMCIDAWTHKCPPTVDGSAQALALLDRAELSGVSLREFPYNSVITGLSKSSHRGSASKAVEVLERMERKSHPDNLTYNIVLRALIGANDVRAAEKALAILNKMEEEHEEGNKIVEPDVISYTSVIQAWAGIPHADPERKIRVGLDLFERMQRLHGDPERHLTLDTTSFRSILILLAHSKHEDAASHSIRILDQMQNTDTVQPDCGCYSACVLAMARCRNDQGVVSRGHELLLKTVQKYQDGELDRLPGPSTFVEVIRAHARHPDAKSCDHALELLQLMKNLSGENVNSSRSRPGIRLYSMIIDMLVKSGHDGAPQLSHDLLIKMEKEREEGNWRTGADRVAWNSVIHSWARSNHPQKARYSRKMLDQMKEISEKGGTGSSVTPDVVTYNSVLNAAAFTKDSHHREEALRIALKTFQELKESSQAQPDHISYGTMMKAYRHLVDPASDGVDLLVGAFRDACEAGQVGKIVIQELRSKVVQSHLNDDITKLLSGYSPEKHRDTLPSTWTRNLREQVGFN